MFNILCFLFGHKFKLPYTSYIEINGRMTPKRAFVDTKSARDASQVGKTVDNISVELTVTIHARQSLLSDQFWTQIDVDIKNLVDMGMQLLHIESVLMNSSDLFHLSKGG